MVTIPLEGVVGPEAKGLRRAVIDEFDILFVMCWACAGHVNVKRWRTRSVQT